MEPHTTMESVGYFGGGLIGVIIFALIITYLILSILLPVFVWLILRQMRLANKFFDHISDQIAHFERGVEKQTGDIRYQTELTVAALQRIKDSADTLSTHAQYQTEVTKHRLAVEAAHVDPG